jgi:hypothetical protein
LHRAVGGTISGGMFAQTYAMLIVLQPDLAIPVSLVQGFSHALAPIGN